MVSQGKQRINTLSRATGTIQIKTEFASPSGIESIVLRLPIVMSEDLHTHTQLNGNVRVGDTIVSIIYS